MDATAIRDHALLGPDEGEVLEVGENRLVIKVSAESQFVGDYTVPANFPGPPLHVHPGFDETFLLLEGRLQLTIGEERVELRPGGVAYVGGSVPHTFSNPTAEKARFLLVCAPGGFEEYFRALAAGDGEMLAAVSDRFGYRPVEA